MKNNILFVALLINLSSLSQQLDWVKSFGGNLSDGVGANYVDAAGNLYTSGTFRGIVDFDPGIGVYNLTSSSSNHSNFLQKLDASGNFVWAIFYGNTSIRSISSDALGNIYLTGEFSGTMDFDPGMGISNLTSNGGEDAYIQKLSSNGNFVWVKSVGDIGRDVSLGVSIDTYGNVYTTGYFYGTVDFNPGIGVTNLTSNSLTQDIFVQKLNSSGDFLWAVSFGGNSFDRPNSISVSGDGVIFLTGFFEGAYVDFDPGTGVSHLSSIGGRDSFVLKLNSFGGLIWVKSFGGIEWDEGKSISVDSFGYVYTSGYFKGTVDFDPGIGVSNLSTNDYTGYIQKLDSSGDFVWAKSIEADIAVLSAETLGDVYIAGRFNDSVDFDPNLGTRYLKSKGGSDCFIQKLNASGSLVWVKSFGGVFTDGIVSLFLEGSGYVLITGGFQSTVDFDPGLSFLNLSSNGSFDIFIQKLYVGVAGTKEIENENSLIIYPNPTRSILNIESSISYKSGKVINSLGQIVLEFDNTKKVDVSSIAAGTYTILFYSESQAVLVSKKLIVK